MDMADVSKAGTCPLGDRTVKRLGYGAMQLAGDGVFGPPRDRDRAIAVLREAVDANVDHIDTSDYYGPHVTNQIIREALAPYPDNLAIVTKLGARRGKNASWLPWDEPADLAQGVEDNRRNLDVDQIFTANLRVMGAGHGPAEGSIGRRFEALAELRRKGLIRHLGLSNVTRTQIEEARAIAPIVCVQNQYNVLQREDDELIDWLAGEGIAYVPFFPLGGLTPLQEDELDAVAADLGAKPMQVALAWLLQRSPNILLIPGTSSPEHLRENLAVAELTIPGDAFARLDTIGKAIAPA
jgi:aryl-alcohol dehydrogenase-like predicted oxidoreductase